MLDLFSSARISVCVVFSFKARWKISRTRARTYFPRKLFKKTTTTNRRLPRSLARGVAKQPRPQTFSLRKWHWGGLRHSRNLWLVMGPSRAFLFRCQRWNSWIYEGRTIAKAFVENAFINQELRLEDRRRSHTILFPIIIDANFSRFRMR